MLFNVSRMHCNNSLSAFRKQPEKEKEKINCNIMTSTVIFNKFYRLYLCTQKDCSIGIDKPINDRERNNESYIS